MNGLVLCGLVDLSVLLGVLFSSVCSDEICKPRFSSDDVKALKEHTAPILKRRNTEENKATETETPYLQPDLSVLGSLPSLPTCLNPIVYVLRTTTFLRSPPSSQFPYLCETVYCTSLCGPLHSFQEKVIAEKETALLKEQELYNRLRAKDYGPAIGLALELKRPQRLWSVLRDAMTEGMGEATPTASEEGELSVVCVRVFCFVLSFGRAT